MGARLPWIVMWKRIPNQLGMNLWTDKFFCPNRKPFQVLGTIGWSDY